MVRAILFCAALLVGLGLATRAGLITGNVSPSAPAGIYLRADPDTAGYVTFCLADHHSGQLFYDRFCSAENPHKIKILKHISERRQDGTLIVRGIAPGSIDSDLIGPVQPSQVHGFWRHVAL